MKIILTPVRSDATLTLERAGDALIVNGERFDFAALPEGADLPADAIRSDWLAGEVRRRDGVLEIPCLLPHGPQAGPEVLFPAALAIAGDGPIALPGQG